MVVLFRYWYLVTPCPKSSLKSETMRLLNKVELIHCTEPLGRLTFVHAGYFTFLIQVELSPVGYIVLCELSPIQLDARALVSCVSQPPAKKIIRTR